MAGIAGGGAAFVARMLTPILPLLPMGRFMRSGAGSGVELARLVTRPATETPVGTATYYDGPVIKPSNEFLRSLDGVTRHQQDLWKHSLRWAGVTPEELSAAGFGEA